MTYETLSGDDSPVTAQAALKVVETLQPDLVLLDVVLPGRVGFEVCRRLRQTSATAIDRR